MSQTADSSVSVRATTKFAVCSGGARPKRSVVCRMASMAAMPRVSSQVEGEQWGCPCSLKQGHDPALKQALQRAGAYPGAGRQLPRTRAVSSRTQSEVGVVPVLDLFKPS